MIGSNKSFELVYLIDASEAISNNKLKDVAKLIKAEISGYTIGDQNVRVAIIACGEQPQLLLDLTSGTDIISIKEALNKLTKQEGVADLENAIKFVDSNVLNAARTNVPQTFVMLIAGKLSLSKEAGVKKETKVMTDKGVNVIIVGLKKNLLTDDLKDLSNVLNGGISASSEDLSDLLGRLAFAISQAAGNCFCLVCDSLLSLLSLLSFIPVDQYGHQKI